LHQNPYFKGQPTNSGLPGKMATKSVSYATVVTLSVPCCKFSKRCVRSNTLCCHLWTLN